MLTAKMTDFGYSCFGTDDSDIVYLPCSLPWAAPEYHSRGFMLRDAKKMDVYSFGMLCLYILFRECLEDPTSSWVCSSFCSPVCSPVCSSICYLEGLKKVSGSLVGFANKAVSRSTLLKEMQKDSLKAFFESTLSDEPGSRNVDFKTLIEHLGRQE